MRAAAISLSMAVVLAAGTVDASERDVSPLECLSPEAIDLSDVDPRIEDGDTFIAGGRVRVRIAGINTPERGDPSHALARDALLSILREAGRIVIVSRARDGYGCVVTIVGADGVNVAQNPLLGSYHRHRGVPGGRLLVAAVNA